MAIFSKAKIREIFEDAEIEVSKDVLKKIFDLHTDSMDDLKDTVKELKTDLENAERERDDYKAKAPKDGEENPFEEKYNKLKKEFDDLKQDVEKKSTLEIAEILYVSRGSVRYRLSRMIEKFGVAHREDMIELVSRYLAPEALLKYSEEYLDVN